jgi:proteasome lid subunit RPN8/RPN11
LEDRASLLKNGKAAVSRVSGFEKTWAIPAFLLNRMYNHFFPYPEFDKERMVAVAGYYDTFLRITDFFPLHPTSESSIHVSADAEEVAKTERFLARFGSVILGCFHSHPPNHLSPSPTDIHNHEEEERAGKDYISAIFTIDGCIRFFGVRRPLPVIVFGDGVEIDPIDPSLMRLNYVRED